MGVYVAGDAMQCNAMQCKLLYFVTALSCSNLTDKLSHDMSRYNSELEAVVLFNLFQA